MGGLSASLTQYLLPAVLVIFLGLYGLGLASGVDAEVALLRAGAPAIALAILGRYLGDSQPGTLHATLISLVRQCPEPRDPAHFLDWLETLPTSQLAEVVLDPQAVALHRVVCAEAARVEGLGESFISSGPDVGKALPDGGERAVSDDRSRRPRQGQGQRPAQRQAAPVARRDIHARGETALPAKQRENA